MSTTSTSTNQIEIPLNKGKIALMSIGSVAFVVAGVWFITHPNEIRLFGNQPNPVLAYAIGIAAVAFFGFCAYCLVKKMFDNRPGMIVNTEGINDNCSGFKFGLIRWEDIENIEVIQIGRQKLIMVLVHNPDEYINRQTNPIMKKMAAMNYRQYQTPISITSNTLKYDLNGLYSLLSGRLSESRR